MATKNDELLLTQSQQPEFEFEEYTVRDMQTISQTDVNPGDVVYFLTESGSAYILEIQDVYSSDLGFVSGLLSRRSELVGGLKNIPAKIYANYEGIARKRPAFICPDNLENFYTSKIENLLVVNFDPFSAQA